MNREEAQNIGSAMSSNLTTYTMLDSRIKLFIDEVYDDIEAQSCQNCQHHEDRDNYCNLLKVYGLKYCSKFEKE